MRYYASLNKGHPSVNIVCRKFESPLIWTTPFLYGHPPFLYYVEEALAFDENFIAAPDQVTLRDKILFLGLLSVFLSFLFLGLLRPL